MIVTIQHLHSVPTWNGRQGFCHRQAREFFAEHDLDWLDFVQNGIAEELLIATGDALAIYVVEHARECGDGN
ncbi:hypothetical protein N7414_15730 [Pseudomonas sp. GD04087]|uniref:hypothetical protein n=1 Tax=unclassified Pseudomonas TaxID=196821 RepID=UPI00244AB40D|nr:MULTISPECIES: hypothetical protein [unclassified Pseudomonas]MDH0290574.1 hypothetical protein [Pseudomonas sp. GD04087]MDH1051491.1 hypothetical protein [Pseudomonas sp. GD03903]MDH2003075.1 hypothetical protein [Pseudomonas sp. GD03691]